MRMDLLKITHALTSNQAFASSMTLSNAYIHFEIRYRINSNGLARSIKLNDIASMLHLTEYVTSIIKEMKLNLINM